jgi:phage/plasmid-like protein (TIGR03299 family)
MCGENQPRSKEDLVMSAGFEYSDSMAYRLSGGKPWHDFGVGLGDDLTDAEFFKASGLDWKVVEMPLFIQGKREQRPSRFKSLVRSTDGRELGVATNGYHPVQNAQVWEFFSKFCEAGKMHLETAGSLANGSKVWALAKTKEFFETRPGDRTELFVLFSTGHEPGFATQAEPTSVRVVCNNTLNLARNASDTTGRFKVSHRAVWDNRYTEKAQQVVESAIELMAYHEKQSKVLVNTPVTDDVNRAYLVELFQPELVQAIMGGKFGRTIDDAITESHAEAGRRVLASLVLGGAEEQKDAGRRVLEALTDKVTRRDVYELVVPTVKRVEDLGERQPGSAFSHGTLWNSYNAVSHFVDNVRGRAPSSAIDSALFGDGRNLKVKALDLAVEYSQRLGNTDAAVMVQEARMGRA